MSDYSAQNYYHFTIDQMSRVSAFVPFLQSNPQIKLHVGREGKKYIEMFMSVFGLKNALTTAASGVIRANVVYIPHAGGCHNSNFAYMNLVSEYFHRFVEKNAPGVLRPIEAIITNSTNSLKRIILLIKRKLRRLTNHEAVYEVLKQLGERTGREVVVFDDTHLPSFEKTLELFYRADVVMGPHGAAMANLLASRPGTTVVEVHCTNNVRSCFRLIAQRLGMRYFATQTTNLDRGSPRCNKEGLSVNITELRDVTAAIGNHGRLISR